MIFADAVKALQAGDRVCRRGWDDMWLEVTATPSLSLGVMLRTKDGQYAPWLCSQPDFVSDDWELVP